MSKKIHWLWAILGTLTVLVIWFSFRAGGQNQSLSDDSGGKPTPAHKPAAENLKSVEKRTMVEVGGAESSRPANRESILTLLDDLATTYDAAELPKIQPYLVNADPEIRQAALNAMLVLGDGAASPLLREAAGKLSNPREATALLDAADHLELPSASLLDQKQPKASGGKPPFRPRTPK